MTVRGIDVSVWQRKTPDLTGLTFLFARASVAYFTKATDGTLTPHVKVDPMYATHIANAKAAGLITGAYHFGDSRIPIADQVAVFLKAAGNVDFLFIDVEGTYAPTKTQTEDFIHRVHLAHQRCGLYHSDSGYFYVGQDFDWVANWSAQPTRNWDFWQYTSSGQIAGYTGRLDLDRFNGSAGELYQLTQRPIPVPPPSTTAPEEVSMPFRVYDDISGRHKALFRAGTKFYADADLTKFLGDFSNDATCLVLGYEGNAYAIKVNTGTAWSDGVVRPTSVFAAKTSIVGSLVLEDVPVVYTQAQLNAAIDSALAAQAADLEQAKSDTAAARAALQDWEAFKAAHSKVGL